MRRATPEEIRDACLTRSANDACAYLRSQGIYVTSHHCHVMVGRLIDTGERQKITTSVQGSAINDLTYAGAERACANLLRRMLKTNHHWINDPDQMAAALRQAGMVPA